MNRQQFMILGVVSQLPEKERLAYETKLKQLREILDATSPTDMLALAMIGIELSNN